MVPRLSSVEGLCSSLLWTACLSVLVFLFYWRGVASFTLLKAVPIPGPRQWPYIGNLPDVIKYGGMHSMLWEYFQRYGRVYKMGFGRRPTIVITDPEMIKQITIKEFPKFQNRWFPEVNPPMSSFLFIAKDDQWKRVRTTLSPTFSATKASDVLTGKLTEAAETGHSTDVNPLFSLFALEVILSAAFGMQADIQSNPDSDTVEKAKNVFRTPLWVRAFSMFPFSDYFSKKLNLSPLNHTDYFIRMVRVIYDARKAQKTPSRKDLLQLMLEAQKQEIEGKRMSDEEVSAQSVIFMVAGFETTGSTLCYMAYLLAAHPKVQEKLLQELDKAVKNRGDMPLYDFVNSPDYLDQVFREVLQLYTPGYLVHRRCNEACNINGITIPQNVDVFMPPYVLHRDPALWPDPEKFDPDRFSPENRDTQEAYSYMPFGVGPRQCIGFRFALLDMKTSMFKILSRVKFQRAADTVSKLRFRSVLLMQPRDPILLKIVLR
ncbi:Thromboxane-A synthase [Porites harrisoni]